MQRFQKLAAKTSSTEPSVKDNSTQEVPNEESYDIVKEGSPDAKEGPHDSSCGPKPVAIVDNLTETQSKECINDNTNEQEDITNDDEQNPTNDLDGQEIIDSKDNDGKDASPSTPLPVASTFIGSGLYIVGMHRKMVGII